MKKRGISPLIATVLVIGFTIVLAALVIQWGGTLFTGIKESTALESELSMKSMALTGLSLKDVLYDINRVRVKVHNTNEQAIEGFIFRVYKNGKVVTSRREDNGIGPFGVKSYLIENIVEKPDQIIAIPKVMLSNGDVRACANEVKATVSATASGPASLGGTVTLKGITYTVTETTVNDIPLTTDGKADTDEDGLFDVHVDVIDNTATVTQLIEIEGLPTVDITGNWDAELVITNPPIGGASIMTAEFYQTSDGQYSGTVTLDAYSVNVDGWVRLINNENKINMDEITISMQDISAVYSFEGTVWESSISGSLYGVATIGETEMDIEGVIEFTKQLD